MLSKIKTNAIQERGFPITIWLEHTTQIICNTRYINHTSWSNFSAIITRTARWRTNKYTRTLSPTQKCLHIADGIFKDISWMKMHYFNSRFYWSLFLGFELTILQHWFSYGLAPTRRKAIIWSNDGKSTDAYMLHLASMSNFKVSVTIWFIIFNTFPVDSQR